MSNDQVLLRIKAKIDRDGLQAAVTEIVLLLRERMVEQEDFRLLREKRESLRKLFESLPGLKDKGDTGLYLGHDIEEGRNYIFRWERQNGAYLFQIEANASGKNEAAIRADFREAGAIIRGYFKEKGIKCKTVD